MKILALLSFLSITSFCLAQGTGHPEDQLELSEGIRLNQAAVPQIDITVQLGKQIMTDANKKKFLPIAVTVENKSDVDVCRVEQDPNNCGIAIYAILENGEKKLLPSSDYGYVGASRGYVALPAGKSCLLNSKVPLESISSGFKKIIVSIQVLTPPGNNAHQIVSDPVAISQQE